MKLDPHHPSRQDVDQALMEIEIMEDRHKGLARDFCQDMDLFETFKRHALLVVGGSLFGACLLYLFALLRSL